jgi:hypothetical protein
MENVQEGTQIYYRVHRQVGRRQADILQSTCTMRKKIRRSTTSSWTMCTKVSRSTTEFMDNVYEGKQIYNRVHGQCVQRQADLLQSSWTMCTKASRSTTEFMDNVHKGKQIYYRVHGQCARGQADLLEFKDMRKARASSGISAERKKEQRQSSNNNRH